jgi:hypothetical protein
MSPLPWSLSSPSFISPCAGVPERVALGRALGHGPPQPQAPPQPHSHPDELAASSRSRSSEVCAATGAQHAHDVVSLRTRSSSRIIVAIVVSTPFPRSLDVIDVAAVQHEQPHSHSPTHNRCRRCTSTSRSGRAPRQASFSDIAFLFRSLASSACDGMAPMSSADQEAAKPPRRCTQLAPVVSREATRREERSTTAKSSRTGLHTTLTPP